MKRPAKKTKEIQYKHAHKRARERYGLHLSWQEYEHMITLIQQNRCFHLGKESNFRSHFLVEDKYIVVYDNKRKSICTFLPPEAICNYLPLDGNGKPAKMVSYEE